MTDTRIRILLAEDSAVTRLGITTLIGTQDDLEVVGQAEDGEEAVRLHAELHPDVCVVDLRLPKMEGVEVTRTITQSKTGARVLILTSYEGEENIFQALKAGALGYLTKEAPGKDILTAIRTVHRGQRFLPLEVSQQLAERVMRPELSRREMQVLEHVAKGMTNKEIAESLGLSLRTIHMFVGGMMTKLDAKSRTEAVAVALERGLLGPR